MQITGKVVHVNLSGGFWGIEADDGQKYCPVNKIPASHRKEGLRVVADISPANTMGIFMWGIPVKIKSIDS